MGLEAEEILGKGRMLVWTERPGVTGVGLIVLGAVNDLFWEGAAVLGEEGGRLKDTRWSFPTLLSHRSPMPGTVNLPTEMTLCSVSLRS